MSTSQTRSRKRCSAPQQLDCTQCHPVQHCAASTLATRIVVLLTHIGVSCGRHRSSCSSFVLSLDDQRTAQPEDLGSSTKPLLVLLLMLEQRRLACPPRVAMAAAGRVVRIILHTSFVCRVGQSSSKGRQIGVA